MEQLGANGRQLIKADQQIVHVDFKGRAGELVIFPGGMVPLIEEWSAWTRSPSSW